MAWNEPGNNEKDPWKNKGGKNQGPPDLDDLLKDIGNKFGGIICWYGRTWFALEMDVR